MSSPKKPATIDPTALADVGEHDDHGGLHPSDYLGDPAEDVAAGDGLPLLDTRPGRLLLADGGDAPAAGDQENARDEGETFSTKHRGATSGLVAAIREAGPHGEGFERGGRGRAVNGQTPSTPSSLAAASTSSRPPLL
jgi:hypothetical protein